MTGKTRRTGGSMGVSVGGATLVMLFAVLCLTLFAVMALVTASHEWNLARKSADAVTAYYEADGRAAAVFNRLRAACSTNLDGVEIDGVPLTEEDGTLSYAVPVDESQALEVTLAWSETRGWEVRSWLVVRTASWEADENLDLWVGE